jgi:hypothetical protein
MLGSLTVLLAIGYVAAGGALAAVLAERWGDAVMSFTKGKAVFPALFIHRLLRDAVLVLALLCVWIAGWRWALRHQWQRSFIKLFILVILTLNGGLWVLEHTLYYWMAMQLVPVSNSNYFGRYRLKENIYHDAPADCQRVVIIGSSQASAQIDELILHDALGPLVYVEELSYPGSGMVTFPFLYERTAPDYPDLLVMYVSERDLVVEPQGARMAQLVNRDSLLDVWRKAPSLKMRPKDCFYATFGMVAPLFRQRQFFQELLLGRPWMNAQEGHGLEPSRTEQINHMYDMYKAPVSLDTQAAMEALISAAAVHGTRILVVRGYVYPEVDRKLQDSGITALDEMLAEMDRQNDHVAVYDHREDFPQTCKDYRDWSHVNKPTKALFSRHLIPRIKQELAQTKPVRSNP